MFISFCRHERGAVLPITALFIVVAIGMLALGLDLGNMYLVKCELQRIADASTLAGALRLVSPPSGMIGVAPLTPDCGRARTAAQSVATSNSADAAPLPLANIDIKLGIYNLQTKTFTNTNCAVPSAVNAVQATASKTIPLYFGSVISSKPDTTLSAQAIVLTGSVGSVPPGTHTLPLTTASGTPFLTPTRPHPYFGT